MPGTRPGSTKSLGSRTDVLSQRGRLYDGPRGRRGCRTTRSGRQQRPPSESRRPSPSARVSTHRHHQVSQPHWSRRLPDAVTPSPRHHIHRRTHHVLLRGRRRRRLLRPRAADGHETSRSAASTIILNRLDDLEFSLTGCDYDHTERDRRRAVAKLTDAAARNPLPPVWRAAKRLLTPKDLRYLLKGVLPKALTPKELGSIVLALAPDGRVDSRDFAVFYGELGAIEQARRNIGIKERGMSSSLLKEPRRRASPDKKWSPDTSKVPEKGTRAYYEWRARQKTRLKMREEKFFGGKRRFWGAAGQRPPTTFTPSGEASLDRRARTLRSAFLKLLAAALDYDRVGEGAKGLDVLSAPMPCDEAARLLFDLFRVHIDDHEAVALSLAFPSSVAEDAVDCASLRDYFLTLARHGLARASKEDLSEEPEVMAFDDESTSFQPQSPGQALDEETASRSLASLAEPEVMAFDDESEVMTVEGGAELLSLA